MRRCFQIPDALFDTLGPALGAKWSCIDPEYAALGIEHLALQDCFVPLRADIMRDAIPVSPLAPERLDAIITPLLPHLPGHRKALLAALPSPVLRQGVVDESIPVLMDDSETRAWRVCQSCLRPFHTSPGRPTQRYCDTACGTLAYAWQTWAQNGARYPAMLGGERVIWGERVPFDARTLFPRAAPLGIRGLRRLGCAWSFRNATRICLLNEYQGRMGYYSDGNVPRRSIVGRLVGTLRVRGLAWCRWVHSRWTGGGA